MLSIKKKYIGKVVKGGGVSAKLHNDYPQRTLEEIKRIFGDEYFNEEVKEEPKRKPRKKKEELNDDNNPEGAS